MQLSLSPQKLLLIDSMGALLSSIFLLGVLPKLPYYFHMPQRILQVLGFVAFVFFLFSIMAYLLAKEKTRQRLAVMAIANGLYGMVTAFLVWRFFSELSSWDVSYFLAELVVILVLVFLEWRSFRQTPGAKAA